eukprot:scaffold143594_cov19-Tisochrysis_lutea.AAC.2
MVDTGMMHKHCLEVCGSTYFSACPRTGGALRTGEDNSSLTAPVLEDLPMNRLVVLTAGLLLL